MSRTTWAGTFMAAALVVSAAFTSPAHAIVRGKPVHGLSLYGEVRYGPNQVFGYVNPNAPKGGSIRLEAVTQTFDSFNSFTPKGIAASGLSYLGGNGPFVEGLTLQGDDEPFAQYCLLCETMEIAEDGTWIEYTLRPQARFHDGTPVTPDDVVFSFNTLMQKGQPLYKLYWSEVTKAEKTGDLKVKFHFKNGNNPELPMIMGQLPVLSKKFWEAHDLAESTLDVPVSSGPYKVSSFEPGRFVVYTRDPNYWGKDLVVNKGTYNFDEIRYDYYRDDTVSFEAFKSGGYDIIYENTARRWATEYNFPAIQDGRVDKLEVPNGTPMQAQGFYYNMRLPKFADRRVREALNLAFDFESLNNAIFYKQYTRLRSYFQSTDLEAKGLPSEDELKLLEPLRDKVPPEVFTKEFQQPTTAGDGNPRDNLLKARDLLAAAGWDVVDGQLHNRQTKETFTFELISVNQSFDRIILPFFQNLEKLGIKATFRVVDSSQISNRMTDYDYEASVLGVANSLSPGNEQVEYWGSAAAARPGSRNYAGVKDPAVDALADAIIRAPDRASLVAASHALDRVLTWNYYTGLHYGPAADRFAYWTKLQRPERFPVHGLGAASAAAVLWWINPAQAEAAPAESAAPVNDDQPSSGSRWLIALVVVAAIGATFMYVRRRRT